jgi:hypothetical protein
MKLVGVTPSSCASTCAASYASTLHLQRRHQHAPGTLPRQRVKVRLTIGSVLIFNGCAQQAASPLGRLLS